MQRIGFIGLGIMGAPMACNLLQAGYPLTVFNRTREKARGLVAQGAREEDSPQAVAACSNVVITMVTDSPAVEEVVLGPRGVIQASHPEMVVIDMSTISPTITRRIAAALEAKGVEMLDAPVSGGDIGAREGKLAIMVGGKAAVFEACLPILKVMGSRVVHFGPSGSGQMVKLCNQVLAAVNMMAVCETLSLGAKAGIDLPAMLEVLTGGAANSWALEVLGRRMVEGDFRPGFRIKLIQKDLGLVLEAARELTLPLPGAAVASQLFRAVEAAEGGELGTQALIKVFEQLGHFKLPGRPG